MTIRKIFVCWALALTSQAYAADEIKLLSSVNVPMTRYGIQWQNAQTKVLVKNLAYHKKVSIVFEPKTEGKREVVAARYYGPAKDGYETWIAYTDVSGFGEYTFKVEYDVAGQHYALDNEGESYPFMKGVMLYNEQPLQQIHTGVEFQGSSATVTAALERGLSTAKKVTLLYTFDEAEDEHASAFALNPSYLYGYGVLEFVEDDAFEIWQARITDVPADVQTIHYKLIYETKDFSYADDNFGHRYRLDRYSPR